MSLRDAPVLLVEDNPDHVVLIQRTLKKANLTRPVVVVGDGESAVDYFMGRGPYRDRQLHPLPALVLLDLKLPRMSGLDVLEWIHQQPGLKRLPIVVLTTSRERSDIDRAYDLGANSYLVKPLNLDALLEMLQQLNTYWLTLNQMPEVQSPK